MKKAPPPLARLTPTGALSRTARTAIEDEIVHLTGLFARTYSRWHGDTLEKKAALFMTEMLPHYLEHELHVLGDALRSRAPGIGYAELFAHALPRKATFGGWMRSFEPVIARVTSNSPLAW